jgi:hypothetical protein
LSKLDLWVSAGADEIETSGAESVVVLTSKRVTFGGRHSLFLDVIEVFF